MKFVIKNIRFIYRRSGVKGVIFTALQLIRMSIFRDSNMKKKNPNRFMAHIGGLLLKTQNLF